MSFLIGEAFNMYTKLYWIFYKIQTSVCMLDVPWKSENGVVWFDYLMDAVIIRINFNKRIKFENALNHQKEFSKSAWVNKFKIQNVQHIRQPYHPATQTHAYVCVYFIMKLLSK